MSRRALLAAPLAPGFAPVAANAAPRSEPLLALFEKWLAVPDAIYATVDRDGVDVDHPLAVEASALEAAMMETPPRSAAGLAALARVHISIWGPVFPDGADAENPEHCIMRAILEGAEAPAAREGA